MRVVVDTNTLISGLIGGGGPPARVLDLWREGALTVLFSAEMAAEYREVLLRPAFAVLGAEDERLELLEKLLALDNAHAVAVSEGVRVVERDPDDNRVLECALAGAADAVVTGDGDLLALGEFRGVLIVSPRRFLDLLAASARPPASGSG